MTDATPVARAARSRPRRPRSVGRRILLIAGSIVGVLVLAVAAMLGNFAYLGWESGQQQRQHLDELRALVAGWPGGVEPGWTEKAGQVDDELPFDQLSVIGSHNSYVLQPTWLQTQIIGIVEPADAPTLQYGHGWLWEQLDGGVRSLELDIRWTGEGFVLSHVPLVANRSNSPDLGLALEEIALWSAAHPGHLPLSVMVEVKSDYMFLDPTLKNFDSDAYAALDSLLAERLGEALFAPDALRGTAATPRAAVAASGWPSVGELRGSVLFFLADNEGVREAYLADYPMLEGRVMFTSSRTGAPDAVFAVRDDPTDAGIAADLGAGIVVRTRADADLRIDEAVRERALGSGAQIVSTDFPPSEPQAGSGYLVEFPGGATARAR